MLLQIRLESHLFLMAIFKTFEGSVLITNNLV